MPLALCPYCGGDHFTSDVIRADAPDLDALEKYLSVDGHWFNQCKECGGWSLHRDGKQNPIKAKKTRPAKHSRPTIK